MTSEHLCLKWNNFESNIASFLDLLRCGNDFVDVTITCENTNFKAHKLILSACSPYFKSIFQDTPCQHPVVILKNVASQEMEAVLRYIYTGETHVREENLQSFLQTANLLQIIGLAQQDDKPENLSQRFREQLRGRWSANHSSGESPEKDTKQRKESQEGEQPNNQSKSLSSFETSEDEVGQRKGSTESESDSLTPWKIWKKTAEERKKLWAARSKVAPLKKRSISENASEVEDEQTIENQAQQNNEEDPCPILSKQLLLPKKRKLSPVLDQNKNVELVSEQSDSSEGDVVVKEEPSEPSGEPAADEEEEEHGRSVLEPEVGLKEEVSESDDDSLPNGDILLQRLKGSGDSSDDSRILRVPNPDVSIFSHRLGHSGDSDEREREHFTLAPNVDVFLKNTNTENLLAKLGKINLFKAKRKGSRPDPCTSKGEVEGKLHLTHLPCPHCSQLYNNLSALKYHVRLMHSDLENKLFCYLCPMNFIERDFFKMHLWEVHHARF